MSSPLPAGPPERGNQPARCLGEGTQPDLVLAGYPRCATTYLARLLSTSGSVALTSPKETHFLAFDEDQTPFSGPGDDKSIEVERVRSESEWQQVLMAAHVSAPELPVMEASASTLYYWLSGARERALRYAPNARWIVVIRDPIERAMSAHQYLRNRGVEHLGIGDALAVEPERIVAGYQHLWHYQAESHYEASLPGLLLDYPDRVALVDYDVLTNDPARAVDRLRSELGVGGSISKQPAVNASGEPRSRSVQAVVNMVRRSDLLVRTARSVVPTSAREAMLGWNIRRTDVRPPRQLLTKFDDTYEFIERLRGEGRL